MPLPLAHNPLTNVGYNTVDLLYEFGVSFAQFGQTVSALKQNLVIEVAVDVPSELVSAILFRVVDLEGAQPIGSCKVVEGTFREEVSKAISKRK